MLKQNVKAGVHLPRVEDLESTQTISPAQIRFAPKGEDGKVDMEAWRIARREGIGASDVACLTGTEYKSRGGPYTLYQSMKGNFEKKFNNEDALRFGHYAEMLADLEFAHQNGAMKLTDPDSAGIRWWGSPRYVASLDRILFLDTNEAGQQIHRIWPDIVKTKQWIGVEVKNVGEYMKDEWGTEYIPDAYYDQVQGQLLATGKPCSIVVAIIGGNKASFYTVMRDESRQSLIAGSVLRFLEQLDNSTPPNPLDGEMDTEAVKEATAKVTKGKEIDANPEIIRHALGAIESKSIQERAAAAIEAHRNMLRLEMGDAVKCKHPLFSVTYGTQKQGDKITIDEDKAKDDPKVIEAKRVAQEAADVVTAAMIKLKEADKALEGALEPYTTIEPQSGRVLKITPVKQVGKD